MIEVTHWATRVIAFFWSALVTGHTPAGHPPYAAPPIAQAECYHATECTLVRDRCGQLLGRPLRDAATPPAPQECPPASQTPFEPLCHAGRCEVRLASSPELRGCSQDSDCVAMEWVCGDWWAVNRSQQDAARQRVVEVARTRACAAQGATPPPPAACLQNICVVRQRQSP